MGTATPKMEGPNGWVVGLADDSYEWYKQRAIRARKAYRTSEALLLITSASIPIASVLLPSNTTAPAILGALIVVVSGLRSIFHWHENYLRFSRAREAIEAERRLYRTGMEPYGDAATRDAELAAAVTRIDQGDMSAWIKVASERPTHR
jgi:hypothetical protein